MRGEGLQREREAPDIPVGSWQLARLWLILLGLIGLLLSFQLTHSGRQSWIQGSLSERAAPVARLLNLQQRERVEAAVELYRRQHGAAPPQLTALLDERLLRPHDLSLWGHSRLSYEVDSAGGYRLLIVHARE